jgi:hypothetical protein
MVFTKNDPKYTKIIIESLSTDEDKSGIMVADINGDGL